MSTEIVQVRKATEIVQATRLPAPVPRTSISIRPATLEDAGFIDGLQKKHSKAVGWFPRGQIEGYIKLGGVLIAVGAGSSRPDGQTEGGETPPLQPIGYAIFRDRYMKRDEVGAIYQMNVEPGRHRKLVGAALLKAVFERAAYGCRLFGCWCAQDLPANFFWEAMGFVPIAFRAGSRGKRRMHIYWQRRIRQGDETTPYWFPSETKSGAIREDRIALPIPPGVHWKDVMPVVLPENKDEGGRRKDEGGEMLALPDKSTSSSSLGLQPSSLLSKVAVVIGGRVRMLAKKSAAAEPAAPEKPKKAKKKEPAKNDPRLVAMARELRDRWMEEIQSGRLVLESAGKYDVGRFIESFGAIQSLAALPAA